MNILFVHQNMPGQYREMLRHLGSQRRHRIVFLTQREKVEPVAGVTVARYRPHHRPGEDAYALSRHFEESMGTALGAMLACRKIAAEGFRPDIVIGHAGWGELTFLKHVWPDVPIIGYWEYYYITNGGSVGFDPEFPPAESSPQVLMSRNALSHLCLPQIDLGQCPTDWQMGTYPPEFRAKSYVCHEGVRTDLLRPNPEAAVPLARLDHPLTRADEVFTYMARNMEPARGFHIFMRSLPAILDARPNARALIIGGSEVSYSGAAPAEGGYRGQMERELGDRIDWDRVHFLGRVTYSDFQRVIQISRCHVYLTVPFVLSWSLLEAMAMGATVVASDTAPVREVIRHGETGLLVDFLSPDALARQVIEVLTHPQDFAPLGPAARADVVDRFDFQTRTRPEHLARMNDLLPRRLRVEID
ncbi:MAG: glycosyltransferase [Paracoccaceae bacterium]|nr:glycosyltransferase [Paracoccaceae bacterium]